MREKRIIWPVGALALVFLIGGCRSNKTDRIRELEADRADDQSRIKTLEASAAQARADKLKREAEMERVRKERAALENALIQGRGPAEPAAKVETASLRSNLVGKGITIVDRPDGSASIMLGKDAVRFAPGRTDVDSKAETTLRKVALVLKETEGIGGIVIEGHTDSDPIRISGFQSNKHLSLERARMVRKSLVNQGVPENLLSVKGFGESQPLVANTSATNKSKNRRVEIVLTPR